MSFDFLTRDFMRIGPAMVTRIGQIDKTNLYRVGKADRSVLCITAEASAKPLTLKCFFHFFLLFHWG
jgi:hypothetical protein